MARAGIDKSKIIGRAAQMANEIGIEKITLKMLADDLRIQTPSLYNHIKGLADLKRELMIYSWKQMEDRLLNAAVGVSGEDALKAMCYAFLEYAKENPGVFGAMVGCNKFEDAETDKATSRLLLMLFKSMSSMNISEKNCNHLIRTLRSFLEGFPLLVINNAFGNPISMDDSFVVSIDVLIAGIKTLENK